MLIFLTMVEDEKSRSKLELLYNNYKYTMLYVAKGILKDQYLALQDVKGTFRLDVKGGCQGDVSFDTF